MWSAQDPKNRKPISLSAYKEENGITSEEIQEFISHPNYGQDLLTATRFLIQQKLPALLWSLYNKAELKASGKDLEALYSMLFDKRINDSNKAPTFSEFDEQLTDEQMEQIAKRLQKLKIKNG